MEKVDKELLVTYDFTPVSENALAHALRISKYTDSPIRLLHVIEEGSGLEQKKEEAESKLKLTCENFTEKNGVSLGYEILTGTIFNTIAKYASDKEARMVIMGTHGVKGMQKFTGSWALKVLIKSKVPFLVVQDKPSEKHRFTDIVFPVDFKAETREKLYWAIYLGKYFNSRVHIFKPPTTDKSLVRMINTNLNFATRYLIQNNIDYQIHVGKKSGNFAKETIAFSQEINADLILITTTKSVHMTDFMLGLPEQEIINNSAKIPVMAVNPREGTSSVSSVMY
jgi:nucleotide-binding universal stress UspA family protein